MASKWVLFGTGRAMSPQVASVKGTQMRSGPRSFVNAMRTVRDRTSAGTAYCTLTSSLISISAIFIVYVIIACAMNVKQVAL